MVHHIAVKCLPTKTSLLPRWTKTGRQLGAIRIMHLTHHTLALLFPLTPTFGMFL